MECGVWSFSFWQWPPPRQPGFSASLPPAPAAPPALGTKEADGARCKAGRPCAPPPGRSSRSCYPFPPPHPEGTDRDPRGRRGETPPATSSHQKSSPSPWPRPSAPARRSSVRHWPWGCGLSQPRWGSPEQPRPDVHVLHRVGLLLQGHRPHPAGLWGGGIRGPHAGVRRGCRRHWWWPWENRMAQNPRHPRFHPGCKRYPRARSEPRPLPRRWRGRGRLQRKCPSAMVKTWRKLAEADSSPPSGHAALIRTKQGRCGKVSNWNGAGPWGAFLEETPPRRKIPWSSGQYWSVEVSTDYGHKASRLLRWQSQTP